MRRQHLSLHMMMLFMVVLSCFSVNIQAQTLNAFTSVEKQSLVDKQNSIRLGTLSPPAASMGGLEWDESLAQVAADYVNKCLFEHNADRTNAYGKGYVGENLYISVGMSDMVGSSVQSWKDEAPFFTYPSTCQQGKVCGHYTQLIWENTKKVGCARKTCSTVPGYSQFNGGTIVVCNYFPGGNYMGQNPYIQGNPVPPPSATNSTIINIKDPVNSSPSHSDYLKQLVLSVIGILISLLL